MTAPTNPAAAALERMRQIAMEQARRRAAEQAREQTQRMLEQTRPQPGTQPGAQPGAQPGVQPGGLPGQQDGLAPAGPTGPNLAGGQPQGAQPGQPSPEEVIMLQMSELQTANGTPLTPVEGRLPEPAPYAGWTRQAITEPPDFAVGGPDGERLQAFANDPANANGQWYLLAHPTQGIMARYEAPSGRPQESNIVPPTAYGDGTRNDPTTSPRDPVVQPGQERAAQLAEQVLAPDATPEQREQAYTHLQNTIFGADNDMLENPDPAGLRRAARDGLTQAGIPVNTDPNAEAVAAAIDGALTEESTPDDYRTAMQMGLRVASEVGGGQPVDPAQLQEALTPALSSVGMRITGGQTNADVATYQAFAAGLLGPEGANLNPQQAGAIQNAFTALRSHDAQPGPMDMGLFQGINPQDAQRVEDALRVAAQGATTNPNFNFGNWLDANDPHNAQLMTALTENRPGARQAFAEEMNALATDMGRLRETVATGRTPPPGTVVPRDAGVPAPQGLDPAAVVPGAQPGTQPGAVPAALPTGGPVPQPFTGDPIRDYPTALNTVNGVWGQIGGDDGKANIEDMVQVLQTGQITPTERYALTYLVTNPQALGSVDTAGEGGSLDGRFSREDMNAALSRSQNPEFVRGLNLQAPSAPTPLNDEQFLNALNTLEPHMRNNQGGVASTLADILRDPAASPELRQTAIALMNDPARVVEIDGVNGAGRPDGSLDIVGVRNAREQVQLRLASASVANQPFSAVQGNPEQAYLWSLNQVHRNWNLIGQGDGRASLSDMQSVINNPQASPELKDAVRFLVSNPQFQDRLDVADDGGNANDADQTFGIGAVEQAIRAQPDIVSGRVSPPPGRVAPEPVQLTPEQIQNNQEIFDDAAAGNVD